MVCTISSSAMRWADNGVLFVVENRGIPESIDTRKKTLQIQRQFSCHCSSSLPLDWSWWKGQKHLCPSPLRTHHQRLFSSDIRYMILISPIKIVMSLMTRYLMDTGEGGAYYYYGKVVPLLGRGSGHVGDPQTPPMRASGRWLQVFRANASTLGLADPPGFWKVGTLQRDHHSSGDPLSDFEKHLKVNATS